MALIDTYALDTNLQPGDKWIGTDVTGKVTRNYSLESVTDYIVDIATGNIIINVPDEEDITAIDKKLKFKDRDFSGNQQGYKIIRADFDWLNIPASYADSIWEIRYEFGLGNAAITLPDNVCLKFNGGFIKQYTSITAVNGKADVLETVGFDQSGTIDATFRFEGVKGSEGDIQFNESGVLGASSNINYDIVTETLSLMGTTVPDKDIFVRHLRVGHGTGTSATFFTNTILGRFSGESLVGGTSNTFVGYASGRFMTEGTDNTALGQRAMEDVTTAMGCVAIGKRALEICNGDYNIAIGGVIGTQPGSIFSYCVLIGERAGQSLTTGDRNIFIGPLSGAGVVTGTGNVVFSPLGQNDGDVSDHFIVRTGNGDTKLFFNDLNEATMPESTIALINSGGPKSIATKEFVESVSSVPPAGEEPAISFTGSPKTATVTFGTPLASANYTPLITTRDGDNYNATPENRTVNGFDINLNANPLPSNSVLWAVILH